MVLELLLYNILYFFRCEGCGDSESYLFRISLETKPALSPFLAFVLIKSGKKKSLSTRKMMASLMRMTAQSVLPRVIVLKPS